MAQSLAGFRAGFPSVILFADAVITRRDLKHVAQRTAGRLDHFS
jgi:hypothetical protein